MLDNEFYVDPTVGCEGALLITDAELLFQLDSAGINQLFNLGGRWHVAAKLDFRDAHQQLDKLFCSYVDYHTVYSLGAVKVCVVYIGRDGMKLAFKEYGRKHSRDTFVCYIYCHDFWSVPGRPEASDWSELLAYFTDRMKVDPPVEFDQFEERLNALPSGPRYDSNVYLVARANSSKSSYTVRGFALHPSFFCAGCDDPACCGWLD